MSAVEEVLDLKKRMAESIVGQGIVAWPQALAMMGGALVGGLLGGRLVRVFPQPLIRIVVITVGTILTLVYAWRYWRP